MSKANQNNKYVKIVILHANTPDYHDIPLTEHEIREIQANMQNINFDIEHSHNYLDGISIKQNYISRTEERINNQTVNKGSWIMVLGVSDNTVLAGINDGDLTGVSLETDFTNNMQTQNPNSPVIPYSDVITKEEMMPHVISFTGSPANGMPLELMTHEQYTRKNKFGGTIMPEDNIDNGEVNWLRGIVEKFTNIQHTSKNTSTIDPQSQPIMNANTDELVTSLIESQKVIPTIAKSMETVAESNAKMSEAFGAMSAKFDQMMVQQTNNVKVQGEGDEGGNDDEGGNPTDPPNEPTPQDPKGGTGGNKGTEGTEGDEGGNGDEGGEGLTPEEEETLKKLQEKKQQHTRKNIPQSNALHPPQFTPLTNDNSYDETKDYIANRTFDYFINGGK